MPIGILPLNQTGINHPKITVASGEDSTPTESINLHDIALSTDRLNDPITIKMTRNSNISHY